MGPRRDPADGAGTGFIANRWQFKGLLVYRAGAVPR
jgi:hypothetical protein